VEFEAYNVHEDGGAAARLRDRGVAGVPTVCAGDRCSSAVQLDAIAELLGIAPEHQKMLPPSELAARMELMLMASQRYLRQVPLDGLDYSSPDRDRSFRNLGYHIFRVAAAFLVGQASGKLPGRYIVEDAPDQSWTGGQLAEYGEEVRLAVRAWWATATDDPFDRLVETYYGTHPLHIVFERSTWHVAQHTRQVMMFLERLGIEPDGLLTEADLEGLPLPEGVWD
jgi:hypothetical protein